MAKGKGRGRLSSIDLLPDECAPLIAWAADELRKNERTQTAIYVEFFDKLQELKREHLGELEFDIPSKSSFNRYSVNLAILSKRMDDTRRIAKALSKQFDAAASDDLTLIAAEAVKTLVFEVLTTRGEAGVDPKGAMALANALRAATQAQNLSTQRREKIETAFAKKTDAALTAVAAEAGLSAETVAQLRRDVLGVRPAKGEGK